MVRFQSDIDHANDTVKEVIKDKKIIDDVVIAKMMADAQSKVATYTKVGPTTVMRKIDGRDVYRLVNPTDVLVD